MTTISTVPTAAVANGRSNVVPAAAAIAATLGVGAACWVISVHQMEGMDMAVATRLGSFPSFLWVWVPMMAAMMLPGTTTAALRRVHCTRRVRDIPWYVGSYLGVWALIGVAVFALDRPHGSATAGAIVVAAGCYELTPTKRWFRQRCRDDVASGGRLGLCCLGSSVGLMCVVVVLGVMSITWMAAAATIVLAQKLLRPRVVVDVPIALAVVALGIVILVTPSVVPGMVPPMHSMPMAQ